MTTRDPAPASAEDRLIAEYFRPLAHHPGAMRLRDDAAWYTPPPGHDLVLTKDAVVAGVHFFPDDPPESIARKALRVNLSDLAAKGADPQGFLLALALTPQTDAGWLAAFAQALGDDAEAYGCPLFGGDTVRTSGPLTVSVTAFGSLPQGRMVHREGARPGDTVFVSGSIGDGALGLLLRRDPSQAATWGLDQTGAAALLARYREPQPRNALAATVRRYASAAMDVSDGLAGDCAKLCAASGVTATLSLAQVPLSHAAAAALAAKPALVDTVLGGGDDYEILCTVPPQHIAGFVAAAAEAGVAVTAIGRIEDKQGPEGQGPVRILDAEGRPLHLAQASFSHF